MPDSIRLEPMSTAQRVLAVENALRLLTRQTRDDSSEVAGAVRALEGSDGRAPLDALCRTLGVSSRHLRRQFRRIVGVTPKYFAQVKQINHAVERMLPGDVQQVAAMALECGFYDQSHFIKAMHSFFGEGSHRFLRSRQPLLSTLLGRSRRAGD